MATSAADRRGALASPAAGATLAGRMTDRSAIDTCLARARDPAVDPVDLAVELARELLLAARAEQTAAERLQAEQLARMMEDPAGRVFGGQMADQLFRSSDHARAADQWRHLIERHGVPDFLPDWDRWRMRLGAWVSVLAPGTVMPLVRQQLRQDTAAVILPHEPGALAGHLGARAEQGVRLNLNHLGEAILGEAEAEQKLVAYEELIRRPGVGCVSVKISSICSQLDLTDFAGSVVRIRQRLRRLYRLALAEQVLVYCDMEEYRDLALTVAAFTATLDEPDFTTCTAGLALQAYLPDSWAVLQHLTDWALRRHAAGGAPIRLRLVKGANLAMEQVEAALHGWPQAPYPDKAAVDANYKRLLGYALQRDRAEAVRIGVGSHNLFDVAYALVLRARAGLEDLVDIEMLEGMANHQARAVTSAAGGMLLYAPIVAEADFQTAIAYLMRRLDENTAPDNFLRALFSIEPGNAAWQTQERLFRAACAASDTVSGRPRRDQDRQQSPRPGDPDAGFVNAADTDWSTAVNRAWLDGLRATPVELPTVPDVAASWQDQLDRLQAGQKHWVATSLAERRRLLLAVADEVEARRGRLLQLAMTVASKVPSEADPEISEAVDFARWYASAGEQLADWDGAEPEPLGLVLVTPPWNFPIAIPLGGVLAALMAGNSVLLKPAPEVVPIGVELVALCHAAGIPTDALGLLVADDDELGDRLIRDSRVAAVTLTGASSTARMFLDWRPDLVLNAETGGKNCLIVTALADRDAAVRDLVRSAFSHAGQKCSAASLAILEAELYDDPDFRERLRDAAASLPVGRADEPGTVVPPLIRPPGEDLQRGLTSLEEGEAWLLQPRQLGDDPCRWTPGIRFGVRPGGFFHTTECFGPVLGLLRAEDLDQAIDLANATGYGLTAGLHSLDEREHQHFLRRIVAGNVYLNKPVTGAIVARQPFGGWRASRFGGGAKAGGPNYVWQFSRVMQRRPPTAEWAATSRWGDIAEVISRAGAADAARFAPAAASYASQWREHFGRWHTLVELPGESNRFGYRPRPACLLRCSATDLVATALVVWACRLAGVPLVLAPEDDVPWAAQLGRVADALVAPGTAERVHDHCADLPVDSVVRWLTPVTEADHRAVHAAGCRFCAEPVLDSGRVELQRYLREQAVSITTHRYGNTDLGAWLSATAEVEQPDLVWPVEGTGWEW